MLSRYDEIWSEEAESHAYDPGQLIKYLTTKIQNSGRHYKWIYLRICAVNRPKLTKYGTQILTQLKKHDKHKSEISIKRANIILKNY